MPADSPDLLHDVFISYARKDASLGAAPLDAALKPRCTVWRDVRGIDPSQDFTAEIEKAIKASRHVVVCVTPDVEREDSFVRREVIYAGLLKKPILVARFADVLPPISIISNTWIDFFKGWDDAFARLLSWLDGEAIATARAEPAPTPPVDPYKPYLETLYEEIVDTLRVSVFSEETITLRAVESVGDVQRQTRRLNPKFITHVLRDAPEPDPIPQHFESLHAAYAHARCDGRVLLLGEPGAGKTTTLLAFARDAAAARLSDPSKPLPVFARIAGWDSLNQTPLTQWLAAQNSSLIAPTLQSLIEHGSALLLLDGLDELGSRRPVDPTNPDGEQYDPRERFLKALPASGKLILSSRVEEYRDIHQQAALNCAVRLEPLDDAQMQTYLADVPDLWQVIAADASLKDALRTPLLLALVRVGFEGSPAEARALRDLSVGDLNDRIWNAFIDQRWEHEQAREPDVPLPYTAAELKQRLGMAVVRAMSEQRSDYTRILARDIGEADTSSVIALAQRLDLLRPAGDKPGGTFAMPAASHRFLHLRLRDTLAFSTALAALHDPHGVVRSSAAPALGGLGDARAVEPLLAALQDPYVGVRHSAAGALGRLGDARAVEPLIAALHDPKRVVRSRAAVALGTIGDVSALEPLLAALCDLEANVRRGAAYALSKLGEPSVAPLFAALRDSEKNVHSSAAYALSKLGEPAVELLIAALHHADEDVRRSAAGALGEIGDARAVEPLIAALRDPSADVRSSAAYALSKMGDTRAVEPLIAALHDTERFVRDRAAEALGRLGEPAVEPLIAALRDQDRFVRGRAAEALGRLGDARAVEPLLAALHDSERDVRGRAAEALGRLGDARAVEPLLAALHDSERDVRRRAAEALGKFGKRAVEPLIAALRDSEVNVRNSAAYALSKLPKYSAARRALADYRAGKLPPRTE